MTCLKNSIHTYVSVKHWPYLMYTLGHMYNMLEICNMYICMCLTLAIPDPNVHKYDKSVKYLIHINMNQTLTISDLHNCTMYSLRNAIQIYVSVKRWSYLIQILECMYNKFEKCHIYLPISQTFFISDLHIGPYI